MKRAVELSQATVECPVCGSESAFSEEAPDWGEWYRCANCTLEFVQPLRLDESPLSLFDGAYQGQRRRSGMEEFGKRFKMRRALIRRPQLWFWTPAFSQVLAWLKLRVPSGSTVLEVGCGLGYFLHEMRNAGFEPVGLDVAESVVGLLRSEGFKTWHGTVDTLPQGWVEPAAIVSFFMLHHVDDPLTFFSILRKRWPRTPIALAAYGPSNKDFQSHPPRTLTRWSARSLAEVMNRAGYLARTVSVSGTGYEHSALLPLRTLAKKTLSIPWLFRLGKSFQVNVAPRLLGGFARDAFVVVGFGEPQ